MQAKEWKQRMNLKQKLPDLNRIRVWFEESVPLHDSRIQLFSRCIHLPITRATGTTTSNANILWLENMGHGTSVFKYIETLYILCVSWKTRLIQSSQQFTEQHCVFIYLREGAKLLKNCLVTAEKPSRYKHDVTGPWLLSRRMSKIEISSTSKRISHDIRAQFPLSHCLSYTALWDAGTDEADVCKHLFYDCLLRQGGKNSPSYLIERCFGRDLKWSWINSTVVVLDQLFQLKVFPLQLLLQNIVVFNFKP